jgi:maltose transport system permease protein malG
MKAMKFVERHAALICYLCVATGALVVIRGGISGEVDMAAYGAFLTLIGFCGRTLLFAVDIYDHLRGIPLPAERELVQAVASLRASEAPELNPLDRHYRRAAAEQEIIAAAEALIKARGWS